MRSIRRAAVAGATAAALLVGAASAATAEDHVQDNGLSSSMSSQGEEDGGMFNLKNTSSKIGKTMDADKPANGRALFGSTTDVDSQPAWARYFRLATIVGLVGSFLGLVVFPAYNFAVANGLIVK